MAKIMSKAEWDRGFRLYKELKGQGREADAKVISKLLLAIDQIDNADIIAMAKVAEENPTPEEIAALDQAMKDLEEGRVIPHEVVMEQLKEQRRRRGR